MMCQSRTSPEPVPSLESGESFVLLVDDSDSCLTLLAEILLQAGIRCEMADSGLEALRRCADRRPLAVLTDFQMPGLDGATLAGRLMALYPGLPIVLITGHDADEPEIVAGRAWFAEILCKPIRPARLIHLLDQLIPDRAGNMGTGLP